MTFQDIMETVGKIVDASGVAAIVIAAILATVIAGGRSYAVSPGPPLSPVP